jgi:hypothetical protein
VPRTINLTNKARNAARDLAVAYAAYHEASRADDYNSIIVWGRMLIEAQTALGIGLADPANISRRIAYARTQNQQIAA